MNWYISIIDPGNAGGSVPIPETPINEAKPIIYKCSHCDAQFNTLNKRQEHFFLAHPFRNPALLFRGNILSTTGTIISEPTQDADWLLNDCSHAKLNNQEIKLENIYKKLTKAQNEYYILELSNSETTKKFELHFCIPKTEEIIILEEAFRVSFTRNNFTVTDVNIFSEACTLLKSTIRYQEGICQYLYGVLAKDQRGNTQISHTEYKNRFNQALEALRHINRPIAHAMRAVINFSYNNFAQPAHQEYASNLSTAALFFEVLAINGNSFQTKALNHNNEMPIKYLPIDHATNQILHWIQLPKNKIKAELDNIYSASKNSLWTAEDRTKAIVLWLYWADTAQTINETRSFARSLLNDATFAIYAEKTLKSIKK